MKKSKAALENKAFVSVWDALSDTREEAANLLARAELLQQIQASLNKVPRTQADAAAQCGITQPRMNDLLQGKVSKFSLDALVNIATALGHKVKFELEAA